MDQIRQNKCMAEATSEPLFFQTMPDQFGKVNVGLHYGKMKIEDFSCRIMPDAIRIALAEKAESGSGDWDEVLEKAADIAVLAAEALIDRLNEGVASPEEIQAMKKETIGKSGLILPS
jgi:hypothetical protein